MATASESKNLILRHPFMFQLRPESVSERMNSIQESTEACLHVFTLVADQLTYQQERDESDDVQEELNRFRAWVGNLGALAHGHSALDWRLRDAHLMRSTILTLLDLLQTTLTTINGLPSRTDLPSNLSTIESDVTDVISLPSDDGSDESDPASIEKPSLIATVTELVNSLYQLSFKIRSTKTRSSKANFYKEIDVDSGLELFSQSYANFDRDHILALFQALRHGTKTIDDDETLLDRLVRIHCEVDFGTGSIQTDSLDSNDRILLLRLATANTTRRRKFRYWLKHAYKLAGVEKSSKPSQSHENKDDEREGGGSELNKQPIQLLQDKSIYTTTEATGLDLKLYLTIKESTSVTSIATTAYDLEGRIASLPDPPREASEGRGFICPYCHILCPSQDGIGRAWRTHVIQDLEPYVCTYPNCPSSSRLYGSRRDWMNHESEHHQSDWKCSFHNDLNFASEKALRAHLMEDHRMTAHQIDDSVRTSRFPRHDDRSECPICLHDTKNISNFVSHLANHLERIATFSIPRNLESSEDASGNSNKAAFESRGDTVSRSSGSVSDFVDVPANDSSDDPENTHGFSEARFDHEAPSILGIPMNDSDLAPINHCHLFRWPFLNIVAGQNLECEGQLITAIIHARMEKGLFQTPDNNWACYRRNYFAVSCSFELNPHAVNGSLTLNGHRVQAMGMRLVAADAATAGKSRGQNVELIQHVSKRAGAPKNAVSIFKMFPTPPHGRPGESTNRPHGVYAVPLSSFHATGVPVGPNLPLQNTRDKPPALSGLHAPSEHRHEVPFLGYLASNRLSMSGYDFQHTFERVQFTRATANNSKRRASQQYFQLMIELWADVRDNETMEPEWVKVAFLTSDNIQVRGRSPSHYEYNRQDGTFSSTPIPDAAEDALEKIDARLDVEMDTEMETEILDADMYTA